MSELGRIGVWLGSFAVAPAAEARPAAREIEELGYDTLWYPEGLGTRARLRVPPGGASQET